jgi:hypothetical protein
MDIANDIANYLQDAGFGTVGTDIFIGQMPATTDGIFVYRSTDTLNNYVPVENTVLDIYVKNQISSIAIIKIEQIKRHIHRMVSTTTTNAYIYSILAVGGVETIERDNEYAKVYKISVEVMYRSLGLIS